MGSGAANYDEFGRMASEAADTGVPPVEARIVYTAFGERVWSDGAVGTRYQYAGAWGYQSELYEDASGNLPFVHVGHRWYDPSSGRFLQRDPIGIAGGMNVYDYVWNLPTMALDPPGLGGFITGGGFQGGIKDVPDRPIPNPRPPSDRYWPGQPLPPGPPRVNVPLSCAAIWSSMKQGAADGATAGLLIGGAAGCYMGGVGVGLPTLGVGAPPGAAVGTVIGGTAGSVIGGITGAVGSGAGTFFGQVWY